MNDNDLEIWGRAISLIEREAQLKRKRVGMQISRLEYGYGVKIWPGAVQRAEELDIDLFLFPARNLDSPHGFDYQYNSIFNLMTTKNLDGVILITTLISNYVSPEALNAFVHSFGSLPLVSIGLQIPGRPGLLVENRPGMEKIVEHLISTHKAQRIAFIRGPESNWEANERFEAYKLTLKKYNLPFEEQLVAQGDFTQNSVDGALSKLLNSNQQLPDAFVFANDEMGIEGLRWLQDKGIKIPGSAALTGFDDINEAASTTPLLSTIRQPFIEMGRTALQTVADLLDGRSVPQTVLLPTEPVIRTSCGCMIPCVAAMQSIEDKPYTRSGKSMEDAYFQVMEKLGRTNSPIEQNEVFRNDNIRRLLEALSTEGNKSIPESGLRDSDNRVLALFSEILDEEIQSGLSPREWQLYLPVLGNSLIRLHPADMDSRQISHLIQMCLVVSGEMTAIVVEGETNKRNNTNIMLREVLYKLSSIVYIEDFIDSLYLNLPSIGIKTFYLSVYEKEWKHQKVSNWNTPKTMRFIAGMRDGVPLPEVAFANKEFDSGLLIPDFLPPDPKRRSLVVYPLFFREAHYGTIIYELTQENGFVYETLSTQISGILKAVMLYHAKERAEVDLRRALLELEKYNEQLSHLSLTDELTALYNRRGFLKLAAQQLQIAKQMNKTAMIIFGDLDGLKSINDRFGHKEGDWAIIQTASILQKTFRDMDIVARLGGDEFTVFASNASPELIPVFQGRITALLDSANASSGKPYTLSISLGFVQCFPQTPDSIEDYLKEADQNLYKQKQEKHKP
jgi:diguanylate cyclase (GGDEF)-like protein